MAITFNKTIIGSYDYKSKDTRTYHIEIRQGNCAGVHIWIDEEGNCHLFNFLANKEHAKNMEKDKIDIFENCENIKINYADKGGKLHAEQALKFGHEVTCYYIK